MCQSEDSAENSESFVRLMVITNEGTASRETHSTRSDNKRTPEFVGEIKTVIDNDLSKVNEGHSQGHGCVEVSYQADSA